MERMAFTVLECAFLTGFVLKRVPRQRVPTEGIPYRASMFLFLFHASAGGPSEGEGLAGHRGLGRGGLTG